MSKNLALSDFIVFSLGVISNAKAWTIFDGLIAQADDERCQELGFPQKSKE